MCRMILMVDVTAGSGLAIDTFNVMLPDGALSSGPGNDILGENCDGAGVDNAKICLGIDEE